MKNKKISTFELSELLNLEKACNIICKQYENIVKLYDGSINKNTNEYKMYTYYNNIRLGILEELEQRLKELE